MSGTPWLRWLLGVIVAAAIVGLLAWARNDPGPGDRDPDPPQSTSAAAAIDAGLLTA